MYVKENKQVFASFEIPGSFEVSTLQIKSCSLSYINTFSVKQILFKKLFVSRAKEQTEYIARKALKCLTYVFQILDSNQTGYSGNSPFSGSFRNTKVNIYSFRIKLDRKLC